MAYPGAVVWTQFYSKMHTEKLGVRSDAAPTSDWPGLFIGPATVARDRVPTWWIFLGAMS